MQGTASLSGGKAHSRHEGTRELGGFVFILMGNKVSEVPCFSPFSLPPPLHCSI